MVAQYCFLTMKKNESFIIGRIKSVKYALKGVFHLITTESSIIAQSLFFLFFCILGYWVGISRFDWMMQFLCFGLVLAVEGSNTAVEKLCDFVHPDFHHKIGEVKDISAGAVTFAAITTFIIACFIYLPYLL